MARISSSAIPSATVNFGETLANAETLTNPQIRTLNNKPAKILIGSRIPVQTSTAVGSAVVGAVSTFEYRDIGIKLTVEPDIGLGDDVKLKTTLEVSSLGASISVGGLSEPTFNTTTAETTLSLKDGERVIIGGLLQNVDGTSATGIAGLMDIPILGKIFSNNVVGPNSKRELVMTLTPHIIRPLEVPGTQDTSFWSGTEEAYDTKPLFEEKKAESLAAGNRSRARGRGRARADSGGACRTRRGSSRAGPTFNPRACRARGARAGSVGTAGSAVSRGSPYSRTSTQPLTPCTPGASAQPVTPPAGTGENAAAMPTPGKIGRVGALSFVPEVIPVNCGPGDNRGRDGD